MTPGARLQAAIDLLSEMDASTAPGDGIVRQYFRTRRYIGSKDRRAIAERVWRVVRHRARLRWTLNTDSAPPRLTVLADGVLYGDDTVDSLDALCSGETYTPAVLSDDERSNLSKLNDREQTDAPAQVTAECPDWLWPYFTDLFGDEAATELSALNVEAPVDLRVNTVKGDRDSVRNALEQEGLSAENTSLSPIGLRLFERTTLGNSKAFQDGLVEVQDEGSQVAALLAAADSDHEVLDFCAGAGGKTLALAASMGGNGRIVATDNDEGRLKKAKGRLKRAGVHSVTTRVLNPANTNWLHKRRKSFDRVLVDAPCSGTGAWRRQPDARWRLTPSDLDRYIATQDQVMTQGGRMVKPGGRLIYVTCSLLRQENEDRVEGFLERHDHFRVRSAADVWKQVFGTRYSGRGKYLRLSTRRHHTDGFFVAILERHGE